MNKTYRFWLLSALILLAAASRWLPHPPNFTPLMAMALFSGALFRQWKWALAVPMLGMLIADFGLGFHDQMLAVYVCLGIAVGVGRWVGAKGDEGKSLVKRLPGGIIVSSLVFFVFSNLFVWAFSPLYPQTFAGLTQAFVMAIPFFHHEIVGNLVFSGVLFGAWEACRRYAPQSWVQEIRG